MFGDVTARGGDPSFLQTVLDGRLVSVAGDIHVGLRNRRLQEFMQRHPECCGGLVLYGGDEAAALAEGLTAIPLSWLCVGPPRQ